MAAVCADSNNPRQGAESGFLTVDELAYLAGTSCNFIEQLVEWDVIRVELVKSRPLFAPSAVHLARKSLRLHLGLGIDLCSLPLVLELLERVAELERRLAKLQPWD